MIQITFTEPTDIKWTEWKKKCKKATKKLIKDVEDGKPVKITDLYKEQKRIYFQHDDHFYGKCVYCESLISSNQPGDIEHFRPKGKVTDLDNKEVMIIVDGEEISHPGYYWLAYEWTNLMPACADCNRPSSGNSEGKKIGKWMKFPVEGQYAHQPGDEVNETPLLINPLVEDPSLHLKIDSLGIIDTVQDSTIGKTCLEVFGLNDRTSLVDERKEMYDNVRNEVMLTYISIITKNQDSQKRIEKMKDYKIGKRPYTIAARKAIEDEQADYQKRIADIP